MKTSYFAQGTGFIAVTDKSPKDFAGVLFIGKGGLTLDSISEQVFAPADVKKLQPVPKDGMPDEWLLAFGYDKPAKKPEPKPPAKPKVEYPEFPVLDEEGENLVALLPLRRGWPRAQVAEKPNRGKDGWFVLGMILGAILLGAVLYGCRQ
jgi:hypothetical protein